jgi:hypothetical protein
VATPRLHDEQHDCEQWHRLIGTLQLVHEGVAAADRLGAAAEDDIDPGWDRQVD